MKKHMPGSDLLDMVEMVEMGCVLQFGVHLHEINQRVVLSREMGADQVRQQVEAEFRRGQRGGEAVPEWKKAVLQEHADAKAALEARRRAA